MRHNSKQEQKAILERKTGLLFGVSFLNEDVVSTQRHSQLRSDAVAVAMEMAVDSLLNRNVMGGSSNTNLHTGNTVSTARNHSSFCLIDPNVAFLMVGMNSCKLGPVDAMMKASLIFVPIADFSTSVPEGGLHWTLLVLQRDSEGYWYPPVHVDSLVRRSATGGVVNSNNHLFAARAAGLIMTGVATPGKASMYNPKVSYLRRENLDETHQINIDRSPFEPVTLSTAPQQNNSCDCGIFLALATKRILEKTGRINKGSGDDGNLLLLTNSIFFRNVAATAGNSDDENRQEKILLVLDETRKFPLDVASSSETEQLWNYDQGTATKFKADLFTAMSFALLRNGS